MRPFPVQSLYRARYKQTFGAFQAYKDLRVRIIEAERVMDGRIEPNTVTDDRLMKASGLLIRPVRKAVSPLWALMASVIMAGAACAFVWVLLLGPQVDNPQNLTPVETAPAQVLMGTEGR